MKQKRAERIMEALKEMGLTTDADCGPHVHLLSHRRVCGAL